MKEQQKLRQESLLNIDEEAEEINSISGREIPKYCTNRMSNEDLPSINDIVEESNLPSYKDFIEVKEEELLSVEDYIKKYNITQIEEPDPVKKSTTDPGATVEAVIAPTITEPPLEDISLESLDTDVKTGTSVDTIELDTEFHDPGGKKRKEAQVQNKLLFENNNIDSRVLASLYIYSQVINDNKS